MKQPTGGVILLTDTTPTEPKTLVELKARKTVKPAAAPETLQDRVNAAFNQARSADEAAREETGGAAEAVGVLTAIDEGGEGEEDAEVPKEFEYHSDGHEGED